MAPAGALGLGAAALGFWWLLRDPPKHYYFASVLMGGGIPLFLLPPSGFVPLTADQSERWRLDLMEEYWGSQVDVYRWQDGQWQSA